MLETVTEAPSTACVHWHVASSLTCYMGFALYFAVSRLYRLGYRRITRSLGAGQAPHRRTRTKDRGGTSGSLTVCTPSTPTITQPPGTKSPYIPTNEVVVTQTPLIRRSNSPFITPRALNSQGIDVGNDPFFLLYSYGDDDNPVQSPEAKACMNMKVTSRLTRLSWVPLCPILQKQYLLAQRVISC